MSKCTTNLIPENIAPAGAKRITVHDSGGKLVGIIPLGHLARPTAEPLYRFMALSDAHVLDSTGAEDLRRALLYAEESPNVAFTCISGDLVASGTNDEFLLHYKPIIDGVKPTKPIYAIAGNHENYSTISYPWLETYTGHPLYYSFTHGNDVFIMVGHYGGYAGDGIGWLSSEFVSQEELQWLYETLEANRNKRCFVFCHALPHAHGVGDPCDLYSSDPTKPLLWDVNDGGIGTAFISLLRHYKNTILFHGHTHTMLELQNIDPKANYSSADGYKSVHIPSLAVPRRKDPDGSPKPLENQPAESEGYVVDVYDGYIVLNGRDFIGGDGDGHWISLGTYRIDTPLQSVEAGTFEDSTGLIQAKAVT